MKKISVSLLAPAALAFLAIGCANPAADAPQAEVADAPAVDEAAAAEPATDATIWMIQDDSTVGFVGSKVTGSHDGGFEKFNGTVELTGDTPETAKVALTIDMHSTWSDAEKLTTHLKSDDFFGVDTYPTSTFTTTSIAPAEEGEGYKVTGLLNLHGVEKQIAFPAMITLSEDQMTAKAEFAIQRFDFGIEYPGKADDLIRDDVLIKFDIVAGPEMADAAAEGDDAMGEDEMGDESMDDAAADDATEG